MGPSVWMYYKEFYHVRKHTDKVLLVCFEKLKEKPEREIRRVAHFMNIEIDDERLQQIVKTSSKEWMLANVTKFDDHWLVDRQEKMGRAKVPMERTAKVTKGHKQKWTDSGKKALADAWDRKMSELDFNDYEALISGLENEGLI